MQCNVECGEGHALYLSDKGNVYSAGNNDKWQCGRYDEENSLIPQRVEMKQDGMDQKMKNIVCGANHNLCISDKEQLWIWGANNVKYYVVSIYHDI